MTGWHQQRLAALDFESSGRDPLTARIVSCAVVLVGGGQPTTTYEWLLNPGIAMEPGAIAVHGITDEYAAEHGTPAADGVREIVATVYTLVQAGVPLVGHNLGSYDLTLLDCESQRHGGGTLVEACRQPLTRVIDTLRLDKHAAPFRKRVSETQGPYQLRTTAETYGLRWEEDKAHGAAYDALKSVQVAWVMGCIAHRPAGERPEWVQALRNSRGPYEAFDDLACDVEELHRRQVRWAAEDAASYQEWLRSPKAGEKQDPDAVIDGEWPLRSGGAT